MDFSTVNCPTTTVVSASDAPMPSIDSVLLRYQQTPYGIVRCPSAADNGGEFYCSYELKWYGCVYVMWCRTTVSWYVMLTMRQSQRSILNTSRPFSRCGPIQAYKNATTDAANISWLIPPNSKHTCISSIGMTSRTLWPFSGCRMLNSLLPVLCMYVCMYV